MSGIDSEQLVRDLLPKVVEVARRAGEAIMVVYQDLNPAVEWKLDKSPLTQADLASHRLICEGLADISRYPVLSEESAEIPFKDRRSWEHFWLVDPLDGTKEFLKRNGEFTVNIALMKSGTPILGVVVAPATDQTYFAGVGTGAHKSDKGVVSPIKVAGIQNPTPRVAVSRWHGGGMDEMRVDLEKIGIDADRCQFLAEEFRRLHLGRSAGACSKAIDSDRRRS